MSILDTYWVFVDDGSSDSTAAKLKQLVDSNVQGNVSIITNESNLGKGESVRRGVLYLMGVGLPENGVVGFIDADGAFPVSEVQRTIELGRAILTNSSTLNVDAVWSSRVALAGRNVNRNPSRHYLGRVIHTLIGLRIPNLPYDTQSGLKLFRLTDPLRQSLSQAFRTRWFFEIEIITRLRGNNQELRVREEPLEEWNEVGGSHIKGVGLFHVLNDVVKIWRK